MNIFSSIHNSLHKQFLNVYYLSNMEDINVLNISKQQINNLYWYTVAV